MASRREEVRVHLDAPEVGPPTVIGALARSRDAGGLYAFRYDDAWLADGRSRTLDPTIRDDPAEQFFRALPGVFADAAPDRWGRTLLDRREALAARRTSRRRRALDEWDYLVGVNDQVRMGALRLSRVDGGEFVDAERLSVPPRARLRELEHHARRIQGGEPLPEDEEQRWIAMLLAPGSSLGGSRPKANFADEAGQLWIAKFPSRDDDRDVGGWEYVVTALAAAAGIVVPDTDLLRLGAGGRTFCARRFDRVGADRRMYASAMTLAGKRDGEDASYLDIVEAITLFGDPATIEADLEQLFRRVVFNVRIANRDDHLRNHGFLLTPRGWRLAPVFDLNPLPEKHEHGLALDEAVRAPDLELVRETAPYYRLADRRAREIATEVDGAVRTWRAVATRTEMPREEIARLEPALSPAR